MNFGAIPKVDFGGGEDVVIVAHGEEGVAEGEQQQQQQLVLSEAAQLAQDALQVELVLLAAGVCVCWHLFNRTEHINPCDIKN